MLPAGRNVKVKTRENEIGAPAKFFILLVAIRSQLVKIHGVRHAATKVLESDSAMTLNQARVGCDLRVQVLSGPSCERLRELGLCEQIQVRKLADGRNLICSVCGTRLAISRELAEQVLVKAG